jgi:hypothetical protein
MRTCEDRRLSDVHLYVACGTGTGSDKPMFTSGLAVVQLRRWAGPATGLLPSVAAAVSSQNRTRQG